jgi:hypothetical protein
LIAQDNGLFLPNEGERVRISENAGDDFAVGFPKLT